MVKRYKTGVNDARASKAYERVLRTTSRGLVIRTRMESFNKGFEVLQADYSIQLNDVQAVLEQSDYFVKLCFQKNRDNELIFDPIATNAHLKTELKGRSWDSDVGFSRTNYGSGIGVDLYRNGVVAEIQFSHYTALDADLNRMERLYRGRLQLEGNRAVNAGILITVTKDWPTSQSVSHYDQAVQRAAPLIENIPFVVFGIEPPHLGEQIVLCSYPAPRSREIISQKIISFAKKLEEEEQTRLF